ncbi:MAG: hypothetical protein Q4F11_03245 [Eubacteriales bacterium]|nr:hypothetical protein [Eubacteriales bacterium]
MAISKDTINLQEIFQDLGRICLTEAHCRQCADRGCLIGYSKDCAAQCRIKNQTFVENGFDEIPPADIRGGYDEYDVLHATAHLLLQCRSCKQEHFDNCVINIIRSCFEIIEYGDEQGYEGDVLSYMMKIHKTHPEKAAIIAEEYSRIKELKIQAELKK